MSYTLELALMVVALGAEFAGYHRAAACPLVLLLAKLWMRCQRAERSLRYLVAEMQQATEQCRRWVSEQ